MSVKSALEYFTGADFISERIHAEHETIVEKTGLENPLPLDGDVKLAAEIYSERLRTTAQYMGLVISRAVGLDLLIKKLG